MEQGKDYSVVLRGLTEQAFKDGTLGQLYEEMNRESAHVMDLDHNVVTMQARMEKWLEHFRDNLYKHILGKPRISDLKAHPWKKDLSKAICIGGGPSLDIKQLNALRANKYDGLIICCDKAYSKVGKFIEPDIVTCIHGTEEIMDCFTERSLEMLRESNTILVLSTHIDPMVSELLCQYCPPTRIWWFNASVPPSFAVNIDEMQKLMSGLENIDTGGNVGLFSMILAREVLGCSEIAMLAMEHCVDLNYNWTRQEASEHKLMLDLENRQVIAIPMVFQGYLASMVGWVSGLPKEVRIINLTPKGPPFINRDALGVEYMPIKTYLKV